MQGASIGRLVAACTGTGRYWYRQSSTSHGHTSTPFPSEISPRHTPGTDGGTIIIKPLIIACVGVADGGDGSGSVRPGPTAMIMTIDLDQDS